MDIKYGRIAFEGYSEKRNGLAYNGTPIPKWEELPYDAKDAWRVGAHMAILEWNRQRLDGNN